MMNKRTCFNLCLKCIVITNLLACCSTYAMKNDQDRFAKRRKTAQTTDEHSPTLQDTMDFFNYFAAIQELGKMPLVEKNQRLFDAALLGLRNRVRPLVAAGADVNSCNVLFTDVTLLHTAVTLNHFPTVSALLAAGAKVDVADRWGHTPLHSAAFYNYDAVAQLLLQHTPDLTTLKPERVYDLQGRQRLEKLIRQEARRREQTFLLASHSRVGQDSPAHVLSQPLFREIFKQLRKQ